MKDFKQLWPAVVISIAAAFAYCHGGVTGPSQVEPGKSAILKIPRSEAGAEYSWQVQPESIQWIPGENQTETFVILLDLDPGQYVVSFASFDQKQHFTHVVVSGKGPAPPPDGPVDPDKPDAPSKYGLDIVARDAVGLVPASSRATLPDLAASFRGVASRIASGTLAGDQNILTMTKQSNDLALGGFAKSWVPWFEVVERRIAALSGEGKLVTDDDYAVALREIAAGLETASRGRGSGR